MSGSEHPGITVSPRRVDICPDCNSRAVGDGLFPGEKECRECGYSGPDFEFR